jgi:Fe2+ transport system protein FeoA
MKSMFQEIDMNGSLRDAKCEGCPESMEKKCKMTQSIRLSNYKPGEKGAIVQVCGNPDFRLRMMEMGFVRGTQVQVVKYAPLSDPIEFVIKGYHLTLRREQAADIIMEEPVKVA